MKLQVQIERRLCQGHGRCYDVAGEVFHPDAEGYGVVTSPYVESGSDADVAARKAQAGCPERAISVAFLEVQEP